jgi:hypothetical protein
MNKNHAVTIEELEATLAGPGERRIPQSAWVQRMAAGAGPALTLEQACELASEQDPRGPLATVYALLEGLRIKYTDDDATTSAIAAIEHLHLPMALEELRPGI